jgi:hypothetical protein
LVLVQSFIGTIHVFFGLGLLSISNTDYIYSAYTAIFGLLTLFFAFGIWIQKNFGWIGTFATLMFVTVADALTLFILPSIPGIPKFAAVAEISYSVIVLLYLVQPHLRIKALGTDSKTVRPFCVTGKRTVCFG